MGVKRKRAQEDSHIDPAPSGPAGNDPSTYRTSTSSTILQRELQARTKLDAGHKLVFRAFKTARGFERQKLGRRRKTASTTGPTGKKDGLAGDENGDNDDDDTASTIARIEAETTALKTLDLNAVTTNYLIKSLLKFKAVEASPALPGFFRRTALLPQDDASRNIVARLCNSNPVKQIVPAVVRDVTRALGIDIGEASGTAKKRLRKGKEDKTSDEGTSKCDKGKNTPVTGEQTGESEDEFIGFDDRVAASDDEDHASDDSENDYEQRRSHRASALRAALTEPFDHKGPDEDEEEDDESLDNEISDQIMARTNMTRTARGHSMSITPSPSPSRSPSPSQAISGSHSRTQSPQQPRKQTNHLTSKPATKPSNPARPTKAESSFLPALTMGGYISGSATDSENDDNDNDDGNDYENDRVARRLVSNDKKGGGNRRGQRARRAIWEAKYGEKAKHVQSGPSGAAGGSGGRDSGWDVRKGATDGGRNGGRFAGAGSGRSGSGGGGGRVPGGRGNREARGSTGRGHGGPGVPYSSGTTSLQTKPKPRVKDDEGPLHPSWEAAKRAKEAKSKMAAPFQGKKVTFD